ncbi:MAG: hypothetical protein KGN35_08395 [Betaproteobacteria bacterium]|nr:hypothetical protein [Betaproteobacteria bacterium]
MVKLDYHGILREADAEIGRIERLSYGVNGALRHREMGSMEYASRIKAFLFYMRHGTQPGSISDIEFFSYRQVVEALVQKGQFKVEALDNFTRNTPPNLTD